MCIAVIVIPALATFSGPIAWKLGLAAAPAGASLGMQGLQTVEDALHSATGDAESDRPSPGSSSSSSSEEATSMSTKRARPSSRARRRKAQT